MLGWVPVILGCLRLQKLVTVIQLTLFLQFLVSIKCNYIPELQPDIDTRRRKLSLRRELLSSFSSVNVRCFHSVDCSDSDSVNSMNSLPAKSSEARSLSESLPKHIMCRKNVFCDVRAPKLSRSTETIHFDMPKSTCCVCSSNRSSALPWNGCEHSIRHPSGPE
mmetsp:Transcript_21463/g.45084  ORF Transcript_21463/g.45084 Transcript_21463/m.45084 type:complete len:164 (+) Transcript_21463:61-552(+)